MACDLTNGCPFFEIPGSLDTKQLRMSSTKLFDEDGFQYRRTSRRVAAGTSYYACTREGCPGRLVLFKDGTSKLSNAHVHLPFPEEQSVDAIVQEMKELSKSTTTPIPQIYSDGIAKARTLSLDIHMPPFESLKTTLYRLRADCFPKVSSNPLEIVLNNEFCLTLNNQNFLLVDKVYTLPSQTVKRLIVFGTTENLRVLSSSSLWLMDGTFSRVPRGWTQLFTIHSCVGGKVIPLIYALLMNKCRHTYCELFFSLKSVAIDNN